MSAYGELTKRFHRITNLDDAAAMLSWDQQTMMPDGGAAARGEQLAALRVTVHELLVDERVADWLSHAESDAAALGEWERANLREMRRRQLYATAVPGELVAEHARAVTAGEMAWRAARAASDFEALRPHLQRVLDVTLSLGQARGEKLGLSPYDALLDEYEPGGRATRIDEVFDALAGFLPGLVERVLERQAQRPPIIRPEGPFPRAKQEALGRALAGVVGFDFSRGRLDVSAHPFSEGVPDDSRITTRYDEADFTSSLMGVLHEVGHALYEQGRPADWRYQPVGKARGMSLHESQSLLIEMQACRGRAFLTYSAPLIAEHLGVSGPAYAVDNLARLYTRVQAGFIRVDADEVTYPLHVILRYRLERAMVSGTLSLRDLPDAWNEGMRTLVGVTPPDARRGCLQDVHWPSGAIGYFPTYTLGAMTAAQLFAAACDANVELLPSIERGDFGPLRTWLRANVHGLGSLCTTEEVLVRATGRPLDPGVFRAHLERRYLS